MINQIHHPQNDNCQSRIRPSACLKSYRSFCFIQTTSVVYDSGKLPRGSWLAAYTLFDDLLTHLFITSHHLARLTSSCESIFKFLSYLHRAQNYTPSWYQPQIWTRSFRLPSKNFIDRTPKISIHAVSEKLPYASTISIKFGRDGAVAAIPKDNIIYKCVHEPLESNSFPFVTSQIPHRSKK